MKIGIISVLVDYHRRGRKIRMALQPQIGPLIGALLPPDAEIDYANEAWRDPDWTRAYDLLFTSSMHSDSNRARQISPYWRKRGARPVADYQLADVLTGIDVIRRLRKALDPEIPAVVVTGTTVPERMEQARANGCELLIKPVGAERLRATVDAMLGQRAAGGEVLRVSPTKALRNGVSTDG